MLVLNNGQRRSRHTCALQVLPEFLSRDGVICHMLVRNQGTQGEKKKNANSVNTTDSN